MPEAVRTGTVEERVEAEAMEGVVARARKALPVVGRGRRRRQPC